MRLLHEPTAGSRPAARAVAVPSEPVLHLEGVAIRRGERWLFAGVDLALHPGERIWLQGPNGCGKSTLLRVAAGLVVPHEGQVRWGVPGGGASGTTPAERSEETSEEASGAISADTGETPTRRRLWLGHRDGLDGRLSALENLAWWSGLRGLDLPPAALVAALDRAGLDDPGAQRMPAQRLSAGQARRAALARLHLDPAARLWILDEPFDSLDEAGCHALERLLESHLDRGGAVLISTHRPLRRRPSGDLALRLDAERRPGSAQQPAPNRADVEASPIEPAPVARPAALSWRRAARAMAVRETLALHRHPAAALRPVAAFALAGLLFPLALGPDPQALGQVAAGAVWASALLAVLGSLPGLHAADHQDGTLEQLVVSPAPLALHAAVRALFSGLAGALPIALAAPVLALLLQWPLDLGALAILATGLLLGLPIVTALGGLAAALTLGLRQPGWLIALIVLPLAVPVLVFGAAAAQSAAQGLSASAHLSLLGACALALAPLIPLATAPALRLAIE